VFVFLPRQVGVGENKMKFYRIQKIFTCPCGRNKKFIYFWDLEHARNPLNEQLNWYGLIWVKNVFG
jgi:hypothetical protein